MQITTLKQSPNFYDQCIKLIEKSFGYQNENKFDIDFYPLMQQNNHHNCFLIIENNLVVAHIGVLIKEIIINNKNHILNFYGAIAVADSMRGKGLFKKLFKEVLSKNQNCSLHLLWSNKIELYKKFSFYPAILQFEYPKTNNHNKSFIKSNYHLLNYQEQQQIQNLYHNDFEYRIKRTSNDWDNISKITSTDLYIKKINNNIENYFFMNKGADLTNVIHEYGFINENELSQMQSYGKIWTCNQFKIKDLVSQYSSLIAVGKNFKEFIKDYTFNKVKVINNTNTDVTFSYNNDTFNFSTSEFLTGILGPGQFEELKFCKPLYICGLDSI